jgi:hypothetical protein
MNVAGFSVKFFSWAARWVLKVVASQAGLGANVIMASVLETWPQSTPPTRSSWSWREVRSWNFQLCQKNSRFWPARAQRTYLRRDLGEHLGADRLARGLHEGLGDLVPLPVHLGCRVNVDPDQVLVHPEEVDGGVGLVDKHVGAVGDLEDVLLVISIKY